MGVFKHVCPECGGQAKRIVRSRTFKCQYCELEFEYEREKAPVNRFTINIIVQRGIAAAVFIIVLVAGFFYLWGSQEKKGKKEVPVSQSVPAVPSVSEYPVIEEKIMEPYDLPKSPFYQQILSMLFEKPFSEITKEELCSIKYLNVHRDFDHDKFENIYIFEYSTKDYKDYEEWEDFEKTIHSAAIMDSNIEEKCEEWDIACFPNLTYLGEVGNINDTRIFTYLRNLTAFTGYISDTRIDGLPLEQLEIVEMDYNSMEPELWEEGGAYCEALKKMTNLKEFHFRFDHEKSELPSVIGTKTGLEALFLENIESVTTLKVIAPLKNLKRLTLENARQLKSLEFLKKYPKLESLNLEIPEIKDLGPLCNCKELKELFLDCNSEFRSMEPVSRLSKLESFEATMYDIPGFELLANCKKLKSLSLATNGTQSLGFLSKISSLEHLKLSNCSQPDGLHMLYPLKKLKSVTISSPDANVDYDELMKIPSIEKIELTGMDHQCAWIGKLLQMKSLKELSIQGLKLHMVFGLDLSGSGIESLNISQVQLYVPDGWDEVTMKPLTDMLPSMQQLKNLEISKCELYDESIAALSKCKKLKRLNLYGDYISDFSILYKNKDLKYLNASANAEEPKGHKGIFILRDTGHEAQGDGI